MFRSDLQARTKVGPYREAFLIDLNAAGGGAAKMRKRHKINGFLHAMNRSLFTLQVNTFG